MSIQPESLDDFIAEQMQDPEFARAWTAAEVRRDFEPAERSEPGCPTCRTILNAERAGCADPWHADNRPAEQPEGDRRD